MNLFITFVATSCGNISLDEAFLGFTVSLARTTDENISLLSSFLLDQRAQAAVVFWISAALGTAFAPTSFVGVPKLEAIFAQLILGDKLLPSLKCQGKKLLAMIQHVVAVAKAATQALSIESCRARGLALRRRCEAPGCGRFVPVCFIFRLLHTRAFRRRLIVEERICLPSQKFNEIIKRRACVHSSMITPRVSRGRVETVFHHIYHHVLGDVALSG